MTRREQRGLSVSYERLGGIAKARNDYKAAEGYYAKDLEISKRLAEKYPDDPNLQRDLGVSYNKLGDIAIALNDYTAAEGYYAKALEISERLAENFPGVSMLKDDLAVSLFKCGTCSADGKLSSEQKAMLRSAAAIWEELYKQTGYELYAERREIAQNRLNQCSEQGGKNTEQKKPGFFARLREKIRAYREMRKLVRMLKIMEKTD